MSLRDRTTQGRRPPVAPASSSPTARRVVDLLPSTQQLNDHRRSPPSHAALHPRPPLPSPCAACFSPHRSTIPYTRPRRRASSQRAQSARALRPRTLSPSADVRPPPALFPHRPRPSSPTMDQEDDIMAGTENAPAEPTPTPDAAAPAPPASTADKPTESTSAGPDAPVPTPAPAAAADGWGDSGSWGTGGGGAVNGSAHPPAPAAPVQTEAQKREERCVVACPTLRRPCSTRRRRWSVVRGSS